MHDNEYQPHLSPPPALFLAFYCCNAVVSSIAYRYCKYDCRLYVHCLHTTASIVIRQVSTIVDDIVFLCDTSCCGSNGAGGWYCMRFYPCLVLIGWYVMARPEGKRVLLISSKGETVARQMSGAVMHRYGAATVAFTRSCLLYHLSLIHI